MKPENSQQIAWGLLSLCLVLLSYLILKDVNWTLGDDGQFITTTAVNRFSHSCYGGGRFWPLGLCDYSVLLLVPYGSTVTAHFIYNIVVMWIAVAVLFTFLNRINENNYLLNLFLLLIMFCTASFLQIHASCTFAERLMLLTLSLFMLFYWKGMKFQSDKHYAWAFFFIAYTTYLKEPVFGVVVIIVVVNLLYEKLTKKDRTFNYALLVNVSIFLAIFLYRLYFYIKQSVVLYNLQGMHCRDRIEIIREMLCSDPIIAFIMIFAVIRAYFLIIKRDREHIFFDGLLFGAAGYVCAYPILRLSAAYYTFPAIILALPSFAYCMNLFQKNYRKLLAATTFSLCLLVVPSISSSEDFFEDTLFHRRNDIRLISYLVDEYKHGKEIIWFERGEDATHIYKTNWYFGVYRDTTNFILQRRSKTTSIIRLITNINDIPQNCFVLCPCYTDERDKNYLHAKGFYKIMTACNVEVYGEKSNESHFELIH